MFHTFWVNNRTVPTHVGMSIMTKHVHKCRKEKKIPKLYPKIRNNRRILRFPDKTRRNYNNRTIIVAKCVQRRIRPAQLTICFKLCVFNNAKSFETVANFRSHFPRSKFTCPPFEKLSCTFLTYSYALLPPIHLFLGPRWMFVCACARLCVLNTQVGRPNTAVITRAW